MGFTAFTATQAQRCTLQEKSRFSHPFSPKGCFSALLQSYTKRLSSLQGKNKPKITALEQPGALTMENSNCVVGFSYFSYWAQLPPISRTTSAQVGSQSAIDVAEA